MGTEAKFGTCVKLEPLESPTNDDSSHTQSVNQEKMKPKKIGEIFHVTKDHFKFSCAHCAATFPLFIQFAVHIESHLHDIYTNSIETKSSANFEYIDVKPFSMESNEDTPNESIVHTQKPRKKYRKLKKDRPNEQAVEPIKKRPYKKRGSEIKLPSVPRKDRQFECYLCRATFSLAIDLKNHFRQIHIKKFVYREVRYRVCKCKICGEQFNDLCVLAKHRRRHKEQMADWPHKCHLCPRSFIEQYELKRHLNQHAGLRVFKCNQCDKSFTTRRNRDLHVTRHTGERRAQCSECGIFISDKQKLKVHMRTHTGELPYSCEFCHKRFRQSSDLGVHRRKHTGAYIHYCKLCERGFRTGGDLRKHTAKLHQTDGTTASDDAKKEKVQT